MSFSIKPIRNFALSPKIMNKDGNRGMFLIIGPISGNLKRFIAGAVAAVFLGSGFLSSESSDLGNESLDPSFLLYKASGG